MVVGEPFIRFYAGVPLSTVDGQKVGTLCIKDRIPKDLNEECKRDLKN
jgi:GAF domain-containing protein